MVKLGFIVEGDTEKILLESDNFKLFLTELQLDYVPEIINACGNGNLLPHNIEKFSVMLKNKGATHIIILTDLDEDTCVTFTKERINPPENHLCVVTRKRIEAWFLADTSALRNFIENNIPECEFPELINDPYEEIRQMRILHHGRGFNNKRKLANSMLQCGFSFKRAASHGNCSSANYFINKIIQLSQIK
ncbi:MAG: DUF4276 family protein [Bacteroidia bacterium]|nr:DUF4276 family protein [Bacteroidia bacterium]